MKTVSLHDDPLLADIPDVDGFKILEPCVLYSKLGEGGMGAVYRGRHLNLNIDVAVKCLRRSLADQGTTFVQRFQREARLAAGIHHQNLVQVYDVSQKKGIHYLVMEFVSGETARDRVRRKGKLGIDEALRIAVGAAAGLGVAHARRIVHRDVKPDNVLIGRDGSVKVSDLGLAKAMESDIDVSLTQGVMGTPQYMAPEQWEDSARVTPAADVWALGATIYFLLAGKDPIQATSMQQALKLICFEPFPDIRAVRPEVPDHVAKLIERCVARSTSERFVDCGEVLAELKRFVGHDQGELVTEPGEETQMGATLVSPPPPETIAKIISHLDTQGKAKRGEALEELPGPTTPMKEFRPSAWTRGRKIGLAAAASVIVLGSVAAILSSRGEKEPETEAQRVEASPAPVDPPVKPLASSTQVAPVPVHVRFDGTADASGGFESRKKKFTLAGELEGGSTKLAARLPGGKVTLEQDGANFELELSVERDGKYVLELDGPNLAGAKVFSVLVDSTGPALAAHTESPRAPLPRGRAIALSLEFDESLKSAE
ncbi:MAG TPA: serine/threonine-protein kinase, partial [Planctomycetota bacterium]|nr:serine/threonine-protein kinase [Planctomycetota bacterium]